ncbi:MAG: sigma-70 family RNA polymerase sigma factor [Planctomycetes bacterium]|nr:sigma-70 family RNA polymerase sigma factor [Planctomycetota bacterium]
MFRTEWDQLLLAARCGDALALGHLIEVAGEDLRATAAGVLGRATQMRMAAEDVFADSMIAVVREIGSVRATNYVGFRYWFASIARNHVRRTLRQEARQPGTHETDVPEDEEAALDPPALSAENQAWLRQALAHLPKTQQAAFVLREGCALSWHTVGFLLERRGAPAARLIHYRALLNLKDLASARPEIRPGAAIEA